MDADFTTIKPFRALKIQLKMNKAQDPIHRIKTIIEIVQQRLTSARTFVCLPHLDKSFDSYNLELQQKYVFLCLYRHWICELVLDKLIFVRREGHYFPTSSAVNETAV